MKKTRESALIVAMAAVSGATIAQETKAMNAALADIQAEYGRDNYTLEYTWNPYDGMLA